MRIGLVHTPMSIVEVPERRSFWRNFDRQYHAAHPGLRPMRRALWELPHWMHWLGGVLVAAGYEDLVVLDLYSDADVVSGLSALDVKLVADLVARTPCDVYLFSPMTANLHFAYEIARVVKLEVPGAVTVFGGVIATPLNEEVARHPSVDYVITDRGEIALPRLLRALETGKGLDKVWNLTRADAHGVHVAHRQYPAVVAADLAPPKIDLFPAASGADLRYLRQVYALGCPYRCSFCTIQTIGARPSYFPIERVIEEIRSYRARYGEHHGIYFGDETFTLNSDRTLALCRALEEDGSVHYDCQTRVNCLRDGEVLSAMQASGCRWVEVGLETGSQASQDLHKNRVQLTRVEESLRRLRDAGLATCSFVVNGFPEQTIDDMYRTIEWVCDLLARDLLQATYLFGLVPYPGSAMHDQPERFGMEILHHDHARYHEDLPPVFRSAHATPDQVYAVFLEGVEAFGAAMSKTPYFGTAPSEAADLGSFWRGAHV
jgi:radical SAM superfamily enzyme YgiQ (UPF0313 family)